MTTYYVSTTGNNNNAGTTTGTAWRTIQFAVDRDYLMPGDTIKVLPGVYNETELEIDGTNRGSSPSGESGNPITLTANDTNDKPIIRSPLTSKTTQLYIIDVSWWTIDNIEFSYYSGIGVDVRAHNKDCAGVVIQNCDFYYGNANTTHTGHTVHFATKNYYQFRYPRVYNCRFEHCDPTDGGSSGNEICTLEGNIYRGAVIGNRFDSCLGIAIDMLGWGNLGQYAYKGQPDECIVRGNIITNMIGRPSRGQGNAIYLDKAKSILVEDNFVETKSNATNVTGIKINNEPYYTSGLVSSWYLLRNNVTISGQYALMLGTVPSDELGPKCENIYAAHNTVIRTTVNSNSNHGCLQISLADGLWIKNNVMHSKNTGNAYLMNRRVWNGVTVTDFEETWTIDGNLWYTANAGDGIWQDEDTNYNTWASFSADWDSNGQNLAPTYEDEANDDYTLKSTSDGYGDSIALTLANGAGTSSTTLIVDDAKWFTDGFGIQGGDKIKVGSTSAVVSSVDYTNNTLYLESAITWSDNAEIRYDYATASSIGLTDQVSSSNIDDPPGGGGGGGGGGAEPPSIGTELLYDPGFDVGNLQSSSWIRYSAGTSSWSIADSILTVNVTATGGNTQLYQYGFDVVSGDDYRLGVLVQGAASKTLQVFCIDHDDSDNLGLSDTISVTTNNEEHVIEWTATASSTNARLAIMFPTTSGDMDFDYVSLQNVTDDGPPAGSSGSTTLTVAAGGDDFYVGETSTFSSTQTNPRVGQESSEVTSAIVWFSLDTAIPSDATITTATLTVYGGTGSGSSGWQIACHAEDTGNASKVTSQANYAGKSWTTASVLWQPSSWGAQEYQLPDLSTVIQELVDDNSGLSSSAGIQLRLSDLSAPSGRYVIIRHYDFSSAYAATLYLEWTAGSTSSSSHAVALGKRIGKRIGMR